MNNKLPTPITILGSLLLAGILAACLPTSPAVSQMQVSPVAPSISKISTPPEPTQTPLPTKPPVYQTTKQPSSPTQGSLNPSSTFITPSITDVPVPVITPNVRIGNGIATSMAVSPDGRWLTVGTQFGVYQYQADTCERAWFIPLKEYAAQLRSARQSPGRISWVRHHPARSRNRQTAGSNRKGRVVFLVAGWTAPGQRQ